METVTQGIYIKVIFKNSIEKIQWLNLILNVYKCIILEKYVFHDNIGSLEA